MKTTIKYKRRIPLRLDYKLVKRIDDEAFSRRISRQEILESTIVDRYSEEAQEERDARIVRRLNRIDHRWQTLEHQLQIISESFACFVRMWLAHTPEVRESEKPAAAISAHQRFEKFVKVVIQAVSKHESFLNELPKEVKLTTNDFCDEGALSEEESSP